jgi:hypothetical protein
MKTTFFKFIVTSAAFLAPLAPASAQITVNEPWVRATVAQQKATGAFMQITSPSNTRLVGAKSSVANIVEIHEMAMEGTLMKMRAIQGIDVPAGKAVDLKPGGYHVMLIDLKDQIKVGDTVPITLVFEGSDKKQQTREINAPARPLNAAAGNSEHKH